MKTITFLTFLALLTQNEIKAQTSSPPTINTLSIHEAIFTPEVKKQSIANQQLWDDLISSPGGPVFSDTVFFPKATKREITSISLVTLAPKGTSTELWKIKHNDGETNSYLVDITTDATGVVFSTRIVAPEITPK